MGMHFMNPVPLMKLVELIRGLETSDDSANAVRAIAEKMGKTTVLSKDFPGFIVNRILIPMLNEACATLIPGNVCTGAYRASLAFENGRQRLAITLETKGNEPPTPEQDAAIYAQLVQGLGRVQPEFQDDWQNVYRRWDVQPEQRILKISYTPWPSLAELRNGQIKARGIIA
jgi:hypothetical protein